MSNPLYSKLACWLLLQGGNQHSNTTLLADAGVGKVSVSPFKVDKTSLERPFKAKTLCLSRKMSAGFTNITSITNCTRQLINHTGAKPLRDSIFYIKKILDFEAQRIYGNGRNPTSTSR